MFSLYFIKYTQFWKLFHLKKLLEKIFIMFSFIYNEQFLMHWKTDKETENGESNKQSILYHLSFI